MSRTAHKRARHRAPELPPEFDEAAPDMPFEEGAHDALDADLRHRMISEVAYHLYAGRGYSDGYDLDDWLQAEQEVDHVLLRPGRGNGSDVERG